MMHPIAECAVCLRGKNSVGRQIVAPREHAQFKSASLQREHTIYIYIESMRLRTKIIYRTVVVVFFVVVIV